MEVKPFVKWAGGKSQLLPQIGNLYPDELGRSIQNMPNRLSEAVRSYLIF